MQALSRYRPTAEAKAGLAQVYFIVASRLNYPPAICGDVAALTAEAAAAKPYPLKVVINNADCLRKTGNVKQANAEFKGSHERPSINNKTSWRFAQAGASADCGRQRALRRR